MTLLRIDDEGWETLGNGIYRKYIHGMNVTVAQFKLTKGSVVKPHSHVHEQVSVVVQGKVRFTVGNDVYVMKAGDVVRIPPGVVHGAEALEDSLVVDVYSPIRDDWVRGEDGYLRS
jgi:quercetin dioxygenase-like cupin family protein